MRLLYEVRIEHGFLFFFSRFFPVLLVLLVLLVFLFLFSLWLLFDR